MRTLTTLLLAAGITLTLTAQTGYKLPPKEIVDIVDAPPTPLVTVNPVRTHMVLVSYDANPPLSLIARPVHRIGGIRIDGARHSRQRIRQYSGYEIVRLADGQRVRVQLPAGSVVGYPLWSNDGSRFAFVRDLDTHAELWWADVASGNARRVGTFRVNDILGNPVHWMRDNRRMIVRTVPEGSVGAPKEPAVPESPNIDETEGRTSRTWTYQDLIRSQHDAELFGYFGTSQLVLADVQSGTVEKVGTPDLFASVDLSPDGSYLLVDRLRKPFSYRVPYYSFAKKVEVMTLRGETVRVVADLPVADNVPTQGVPTGPRSVNWQPGHPARLIWVEALDGGDPTVKVPFRDSVVTFDRPFTGQPKSAFRIQQRYAGFDWTGTKDQLWVSERDRDRRWVTTSQLMLSDPVRSRRVLFDLSWNDAYNDPGNPLTERTPSGEQVMTRDGDWVYLFGRGATPGGDRPFLDRYNLSTRKSERLFRSPEDKLERFVSFVGTSRNRIVIMSESPSDPPNYYIHDLRDGSRVALTSFADPAPSLTGMKKQLLKYSRADGVPLSGTLYLPADHTPSTRLPCLVWAYPQEYSDPATAGQVRAAPNAFTFFRGTTPLFFITQGYAVLMDATMPVVGDPETMNNTFVEQIVASSKAAIDTLDAMGVIDPKRVLVSGHSYGAFMTANALAHSDLFAAGIARSGAYNRSLTPFGFQSERRSFWEARETYMRVSPFTYANQINEPVLIIHGEADNNTGTYPIQSERLFQAIRANGGTARLVMLPHESHGYAARESVLHVLAEMLEWGERFVKQR